MFTCKQVSTALGEKDHARMTAWERIGLRVHVALCAICGKYNQQVMDTHDMLRAYRHREDQGVELPDVELDDESANQIKQALRASSRQ